MRLYLLFLLFIVSYSSFSQSKKISDPQVVFNNLKNELVELQIKSWADTFTFPYSNISVIDKRYDTSAIGYLRYDDPHKKFYKLITKNYLSSDLEIFINSIYKNKFTADKPSLLIVIRKLRFDKDYDFNSMMAKNDPATFFLTLGIDCFAYSQGGYTPLIKKDTVIELIQKRKAVDKGIFIGENFYAVLTNLIKISSANMSARRKQLTYSEMNEYYNKKFREPILNDQNLKKGVYMSFDQFKKNEPQYLDFEIKEGAFADDIFIPNGANPVLLKNVWGYSDGKNLFIKLGKSLFQLYRQGNTFLLMGNDNLSHRIGTHKPTYSDPNPGINMGANAIGSILFSDKFKLEYIPLELDMETGGIY